MSVLYQNTYQRQDPSQRLSAPDTYGDLGNVSLTIEECVTRISIIT